MSENIQDGKYQAKPTCCGLTESTNGHAQFAIECAVQVPVEGGEPRTVLLTKFQTLNNDQGLGYAEQDARACGCDTSKEIQEWMVDGSKSVTVVVENREHDGKTFTNLKSIYSNDREGGYLIKKNRLDVAANQDKVLDLNSRMAAIRALRAQNAGQVPTQQAHGGSNGTNGNGGAAKAAAPKPPAVAVPPKAKVPF